MLSHGLQFYSAKVSSVLGWRFILHSPSTLAGTVLDYRDPVLSSIGLASPIPPQLSPRLSTTYTRRCRAFRLPATVRIAAPHVFACQKLVLTVSLAGDTRFNFFLASTASSRCFWTIVISSFHFDNSSPFSIAVHQGRSSDFCSGKLGVKIKDYWVSSSHEHAASLIWYGRYMFSV